MDRKPVFRKTGCLFRKIADAWYLVCGNNPFILYSENGVDMNDEYLIISNSNFLLRVSVTQIAYVSSGGSYCVLKLVDGSEYTFSSDRWES